MEFVVWIAYSWRRRGVRNLDVGLPFYSKANSVVRDKRVPLHVFSHSDTAFAAVSYLRIKRAILKENSESENDFTDHHATDGPIHGISEPLTVSLPFNLVDRQVREATIGRPSGTSSARLVGTSR